MEHLWQTEIKLNNKDIKYWRCIMNAYNKSHQNRKILNLFKEMNKNGIEHTEMTYLVTLKACGNLRTSTEISNIHQHINQNHCQYRLNTKILNSSIANYGKCNDLKNASKTFNSMESEDIQDIITYTSMMTISERNRSYSNVIELYHKLKRWVDNQHDESSFDMPEVSYVMALKAAANLKQIQVLKEIHEDINHCRDHNNKHSLIALNSLITCYAKCGDAASSEHVFNAIPIKNRTVDTYNNMMTVYEANGLNKQVMKMYQDMKQVRNIEIDAISFVIVLKAAGNLKDLKAVQCIHDEIESTEYYNTNIQVATALVSAYGKCEDIETVTNVFNAFGEQNADKLDIIIYNALMSAYVENGEYQNVIDLYHSLKNAGSGFNLKLNQVSHLIVLTACAKGEFIELALQIHQELVAKNSDYLKDWLIQAQLIHIYGKCASLDIAEDIFYNQVTEGAKKNEVSVWNAIIQSYGSNGGIDDALRLFDEMISDKYGLIPDEVTYIGILYGCSHCGDTQIAEKILNHSRLNGLFNYNVCAAMIDCYSRKGELIQALELIQEYEQCTESKDHHYKIWMALFAGCKKHGNVDLGNQVYDILTNRFGVKIEEHHKFEVE